MPSCATAGSPWARRIIWTTSAATSVPAVRRGPVPPASNRSLPVDLDVFFAAAVGDRDHDADADHDRDTDQSPRGADALQNTQFPERGQETTNQDNETKKIHTC